MSVYNKGENKGQKRSDTPTPIWLCDFLYELLSVNEYKNIFILILSALSIYFWLITVPQFRFGFSSIIIFCFILLNFIFNKKIIFNKKKFYHILFIGLLVLNVKSINRIFSEFQREDFYKFKNFPYFNEIEIKNDYSNLNRTKFFHIEILK